MQTELGARRSQSAVVRREKKFCKIPVDTHQYPSIPMGIPIACPRVSIGIRIHTRGYSIPVRKIEQDWRREREDLEREPLRDCPRFSIPELETVHGTTCHGDHSCR
jgi:hypothetical protein